MGDATKTATDETFRSDVLQNDKPVLVDFWAEWCQPCKMVAPVLDEIATEKAGALDVVKVNIDENPQIARDYRVMTIPMLTIFKGGEIVKSFNGAKSKGFLLKELEDVL